MDEAGSSGRRFLRRQGGRIFFDCLGVAESLVTGETDRAPYFAGALFALIELSIIHDPWIINNLSCRGAGI